MTLAHIKSKQLTLTIPPFISSGRNFTQIRVNSHGLIMKSPKIWLDLFFFYILVTCFTIGSNLMMEFFFPSNFNNGINNMINLNTDHQSNWIEILPRGSTRWNWFWAVLISKVCRVLRMAHKDYVWIALDHTMSLIACTSSLIIFMGSSPRICESIDDMSPLVGIAINK